MIDVDRLEHIIIAAAKAAADPLRERLEAVEARLLQVENRPELRYRGVWEISRQYQAGDICTDHGGMWHCNQPTTDRPGEGATAWRLCVKKGRDGKDGRDSRTDVPGRAVGPRDDGRGL
jgi:hypothetical protein